MKALNVLKEQTGGSEVNWRSEVAEQSKEMKLLELKSQGHLFRAGPMACRAGAGTIESQSARDGAQRRGWERRTRFPEHPPFCPPIAFQCLLLTKLQKKAAAAGKSRGKQKKAGSESESKQTNDWTPRILGKTPKR